MVETCKATLGDPIQQFEIYGNLMEKSRLEYGFFQSAV